MRTILEFGRSFSGSPALDRERHLLVHCHAGVSRSTAAMAIVLAQIHPEQDEDSIFARLVGFRANAWPNSRMIDIADGLLSRDGRLNRALRRFYLRQLMVFPQTEKFMRENGFHLLAEWQLRANPTPID